MPHTHKTNMFHVKRICSDIRDIDIVDKFLINTKVKGVVLKLGKQYKFDFRTFDLTECIHREGDIFRLVYVIHTDKNYYYGIPHFKQEIVDGEMFIIKNGKLVPYVV